MSKSLKMRPLPTYTLFWPGSSEGEVVKRNLSRNENGTHCIEWFSLDCRN